MEAHGTAATHRGPVPRLRPLSLGEILDVAIKLCIAHRTTLLKAIVFVIVPVQVLATVVMVSTGSADYDVFGDTQNQTNDESNTYLAGQGAAFVLQTIAIVLVTAVCFRVFARAYLVQRTSWRESLRFALKRIPQMLWLGFLYVLAFVAVTALLIVPAAIANTPAAWVVAVVILFALYIWFSISWSFALPALFVEDARGVEALRRSLGLVRGRWWPTFGTIIIGYILASVVSAVAQGVFAIVIVAGVDSSSVLAVVIISLAGLVGYALTTPFQAALLLVIYFDLRVRKEGFDLELLAERFGADDGGEAPLAPVSAPPLVPATLEGDSVNTPYWPAPRAPEEDTGLAPPPPDLEPPPPGWAPPASPPPDAAPERGDGR